MSISLGSTSISNIYLGSTSVTAAYLGSTQVFGGTTPITLPSGAVVVYDFSNAASWPGSGRLVYDLSGNGITGSLYDVVGSGSTGALNFNSSNARLEVISSSVFNSAMTQRKGLFAAVQYQTGSINNNTGFINTWGGTPDLGYAFFINAGTGTNAALIRAGTQIYNSNGSGAEGDYLDPSTISIATGSAAHTYAINANITATSASIYNDNVYKDKVVGLTSTKFFVYGGNALTANGFKVGNFLGTGQNFLGNMYKVVIYNRTLSDSEMATVEAWMTGSN